MYNYSDQLIVSLLEHSCTSTAVLTRSLTLFFGVRRTLLSFKSSRACFSFFFGEVFLGGNLVVECAVFLYYFVTICKTSVQLASIFSKTSFLRRFLMGILNISATTALFDVFLEYRLFLAF